MSDVARQLPDASRPIAPGLRLTRPSQAELEAVLRVSGSQSLTYPDVGATDHIMPSGWYQTDQTVTLGEDDATWTRAVEALHTWRMFDIPWIDLLACGPPQRDQDVVFASRQFGLWGVHAVRVVQTWQEQQGPQRRVGFAYGTLPHHAVAGEERFSLRQDEPGEPIIFRVRQFSRPRSWLLSALRPASRAVQDAFVRDALRAMQRAVRP